MNISTVNELIQSLESAGELSIKERKYLELAKAFKQLAAENVELKGALTGRAYINFIKANGWNVSASTVNGKFVNFADPEVDFGSMVFAHAKKLVDDIKTPATDRIVAGIKAEAKSHDLNAFISHYSAELDTHIANGGDQFDERSVRLRGVIVGARMFREKLRDEEKALALREGADK
ncbi:MAG: hypothetical protein E7G14_05840 [Klebsiella michiganensis]|nr:hypothetical protein [Klebsiella michiganensis]MDU3715322.1 hypothetical protein [Klebsiella michiganensis]